ncbi:unnamed protein product [Chrysoparadoxa australica]
MAAQIGIDHNEIAEQCALRPDQGGLPSKVEVNRVANWATHKLLGVTGEDRSTLWTMISSAFQILIAQEKVKARELEAYFFCVTELTKGLVRGGFHCYTGKIWKSLIEVFAQKLKANTSREGINIAKKLFAILWSYYLKHSFLTVSDCVKLVGERMHDLGYSACVKQPSRVEKVERAVREAQAKAAAEKAAAEKAKAQPPRGPPPVPPPVLPPMVQHWQQQQQPRAHMPRGFVPQHAAQAMPPRPQLPPPPPPPPHAHARPPPHAGYGQPGYQAHPHTAVNVPVASNGGMVDDVDMEDVDMEDDLEIEGEEIGDDINYSPENGELGSSIVEDPGKSASYSAASFASGAPDLEDVNSSITKPEDHMAVACDKVVIEGCALMQKIGFTLQLSQETMLAAFHLFHHYRAVGPVVEYPQNGRKKPLTCEDDHLPSLCLSCLFLAAKSRDQVTKMDKFLYVIEQLQPILPPYGAAMAKGIMPDRERVLDLEHDILLSRKFDVGMELPLKESLLEALKRLRIPIEDEKVRMRIVRTFSEPCYTNTPLCLEENVPLAVAAALRYNKRDRVPADMEQKLSVSKDVVAHWVEVMRKAKAAADKAQKGLRFYDAELRLPPSTRKSSSKRRRHPTSISGGSSTTGTSGNDSAKKARKQGHLAGNQEEQLQLERRSSLDSHHEDAPGAGEDGSEKKATPHNPHSHKPAAGTHRARQADPRKHPPASAPLVRNKLGQVSSSSSTSSAQLQQAQTQPSPLERARHVAVGAGASSSTAPGPSESGAIASGKSSVPKSKKTAPARRNGAPRGMSLADYKTKQGQPGKPPQD